MSRMDMPLTQSCGDKGGQLVASPGERPQPNTLDGVDGVADLGQLEVDRTFGGLHQLHDGTSNVQRPGPLLKIRVNVPADPPCLSTPSR